MSDQPLGTAETSVAQLPDISFGSLDLAPSLMRGIEGLGFEKCSPIQAQILPHTLEGHDAIGKAQTGTGKTAAFLLPILQMISTSPSTRNRHANTGAAVAAGSGRRSALTNCESGTCAVGEPSTRPVRLAYAATQRGQNHSSFGMPGSGGSQQYVCMELGECTSGQKSHNSMFSPSSREPHCMHGTSVGIGSAAQDGAGGWPHRAKNTARRSVRAREARRWISPGPMPSPASSQNAH